MDFGTTVEKTATCQDCGDEWTYEGLSGLDAGPTICDGCSSDEQEHIPDTPEDRAKDTYRKRRGSTIPDFYRENHLDGPIPDEISNLIEEMDTCSSIRGAYLHGSPGTGKTTYLCRAIDRALKQKICDERDVKFTPIYTTELWLKHDLQSRFDQSGQSPQQAMDRYLESDMLVIDELGKASHTDWTLEILFMLVNQRQMSGNLTIFGSNYSIKGLRDRGDSDLTGQAKFGMDITSKIWEICGRGEYVTELTKNWRTA